MEESFSTAVAEWGDFHTFLGTAAFTLLGLLFVALTLRLTIFHRQELADIRDFALLTFGNYFVLMLIALLFFIPGQSRAGVALPLALMGVLGLAGIVMLIWEARRVNRGPNALRWQQYVGFGLSGIPYVLLLVVAGMLLAGNTSGFYWLAGIEAALLVVSSFNVWALLARAQADSGSDT